LIHLARKQTLRRAIVPRVFVENAVTDCDTDTTWRAGFRMRRWPLPLAKAQISAKRFRVLTYCLPGPARKLLAGS